jgi:hypothetical protein
MKIKGFWAGVYNLIFGTIINKIRYSRIIQNYGRFGFATKCNKENEL